MVGPLPLPFRLLASLIRCLPTARYRAASLLCRHLPSRFVTRLPRRLCGLAFVCEPADLVSRTAFAGCWEPTQTLLIHTLLQPGMSFVDVGAQWGYFTLVAAARVGPYGSVLSLEPHTHLFGLLQNNLALNRLRQVTPLPVAAGAATGYQVLVPYDERSGNFGGSWLRPGTPPASAMREETGERVVEVRPLDALAREHELGFIDLVKVDVEGSEGAAIQGMRELLSHARVRRLIIEVHAGLLERCGGSLTTMYDDLRSAGYRGLAVREDRPTARAIAYGRRRDVRGLLRPLNTRVPLAGSSHQLWVAPGIAA